MHQGMALEKSYSGLYQRMGQGNLQFDWLVLYDIVCNQTRTTQELCHMAVLIPKSFLH